MAKNYDTQNDWDYKPKQQSVTHPVKINKNMRRCKTCKAIIAKSATRCPKCGAKKPLPERPIFWVFITLFWIIIVIPAIFGSSSKKEKPPKIEQESISADNPVSTQDTNESRNLMRIGETAEMNNIQVTMTGYFEGNGDEFSHPKDGNIFVYAEFDIANNTDHEMIISSVLNFEAYADDYKLDFSTEALFSTDLEKQLDGTIEAGKRLKGLIGYEVPADWNNIEIYFRDDIWKNNKFVFLINRNDAPMK